MNKIFISHRAVSVTVSDISPVVILCACGLARNDDTAMMSHISSANRAMEKEMDEHDKEQEAEAINKHNEFIASMGFRRPVQH